MKRNNLKLSEIETKFLFSLLENGGKTDAQIAREIKVSKATAHRTRKKLEMEDILVDCIPIVNLDKLNIKFFAIVMFQWNKFDDEKMTNDLLKDLKNDPHVVYLAAGDSSEGLTNVMMLGFPDLSAYHSYIQEFRKKYKNYADNIRSFFIPSEKILKQDYTGLVKHILETINEKENPQNSKNH